MSQDDVRLRALFARDEPPARDAAFSAAIMERLMRRRFQQEVAVLSLFTIAGGVALWILWPVLHPTLVSLSQGFAPALGAIGLGVCAWIVLGGRPCAAPGAVT